MSTYTIGPKLDRLILIFVFQSFCFVTANWCICFFCIYVLCTYKRCASHFFSHSRAFFTLNYVYVQASRTRISEAYTELESTLAYKKLENNIILNDYFNVSNRYQPLIKLVGCDVDTPINIFLNHAI